MTITHHDVIGNAKIFGETDTTHSSVLVNYFRFVSAMLKMRENVCPHYYTCIGLLSKAITFINVTCMFHSHLGRAAVSPMSPKQPVTFHDSGDKLVTKVEFCKKIQLWGKLPHLRCPFKNFTGAISDK